MLTSKDKLKTAHDWIEKLANGINPITLEPVMEKDIINDVHISRCLFFVSEILAKLEAHNSTPNRQRSFRLSSSEAERIPITSPSGIVQFTRIVNEHIPEDMKPLSVKMAISWLRNEGYLYEEIVDDRRKTNLPTEKGNELGITVRIERNADGQEFRRVIYDISAQRFMLSNIESIGLTK